jgi:hypothetical protein
MVLPYRGMPKMKLLLALSCPRSYVSDGTIRLFFSRRAARASKSGVELGDEEIANERGEHGVGAEALALRRSAACSAAEWNGAGGH